jgi:subtilase family serine protease
MKRSVELILVAMAVVLFCVATSLWAQEALSGPPIKVSETAEPTPVHYPSAPGKLFIPASSLPQPTPAGHRFAAHTNVELLAPAGLKPDSLPPFPGYGFETPASLACAYSLPSEVVPCNPNNNTLANPSGGSKTIAIVDAYDDPSAPGDLAWFSLQFGLPLSLTQFNVVLANTANSSCSFAGVPIDATGGWEIEESLDIEWSHAMAPGATIDLVEACSNFDTDLQQAVMVANNLVTCGVTGINPLTLALTYPYSCTPSAGEVSMSWGGGEGPDETGSTEPTPTSCLDPDDTCFTATNVVYFAAAGDSPGVIWPGTSPNVVSAGGLSNRRNPSTFNLLLSPTYEAAWVDAGGGQSAYETIPDYQSAWTDVTNVCGTTYRCVPDVSFDADPNTGVYVYDTFPIDGFEYIEWIVIGGTSVSAPSLAGIINNAAGRTGGSFAASSNAELKKMYGNLANVTLDYDKAFSAVTYGYCGFYMGFGAGGYWNFCTGLGAVHTYTGK